MKDVIHSAWQAEGITPFHTEHIMPNGTVEVIFNFSDSPSVQVQIGDRKNHLPNCFINGFNTEPIQIQLPRKQAFFGVRLHPLAIKKIFKIPAREFSNSTVDLTLLDPEFNSLWHQLGEQNSFDERISSFYNWVERKLPEWQPQEKLMNHFLCDVNQHDLSVTALAGSLYYSPRYLSRKFFEATGMNTEEILLYKKYLHAVHLIHHTDLSLTAIAYQSDFSDQAHFIRSFKAYTKMTPGDYKRSKSHLKGHIYENVR
ncbi:MAG TPA: AraC family transcriptional regulator [Chitinophagaceae bacterium]